MRIYRDWLGDKPEVGFVGKGGISTLSGPAEEDFQPALLEMEGQEAYLVGYFVPGTGEAKAQDVQGLAKAGPVSIPEEGFSPLQSNSLKSPVAEANGPIGGRFLLPGAARIVESPHPGQR